MGARTVKRPENGRGLFYTRDSGGKHEMTPSEYVGWAQRTAEELEVTFDGTPEDIETMIRNGQSERGDVFLDFGVSGNVMSRPGLSALTGTIRKDSNVSHVFIPRRNRLARPNDTMDAVTLENNLRRLGVTIVFMDKKCSPLKKGSRQDIADLITAAIDYDRSSEDRYELAQKVLYAQLRLAKSGYSTGGRPPYGFCRWLVKEDGTKVRELAEGEYVKMRGHHVVWLPSSEEHWAVIRRVLKMLDTMPASQVAKTLTYEKIPTPDHGRYRTDNGQRHATSGVWHQSTIINIARNPLLLAGVEYGRRSMGDQLRFTPDGPRQLEDTDFRAGGDESQAGDKPKVIRNPKETRIIAKASFEPLVDPKQHRRLLEKLDKRAGTQRGKPRSRDPNNNPARQPGVRHELRLASLSATLRNGISLPVWPLPAKPWRSVQPQSCRWPDCHGVSAKLHSSTRPVAAAAPETRKPHSPISRSRRARQPTGTRDRSEAYRACGNRDATRTGFPKPSPRRDRRAIPSDRHHFRSTLRASPLDAHRSSCHREPVDHDRRRRLSGRQRHGDCSPVDQFIVQRR